MAALSADVPFESCDEIAARLARYEQQFSNRYTEDDNWYARTCQQSGRSHQVPIMNTWPQKKPYNRRKRYEDANSGPHSSRGGYFGERYGRDRGYHRDRYDHHSYGHGGWRGGHYGGEGYRGHSPSRGEGYRGHSPSRGEGYRGHSPSRSPSGHHGSTVDHSSRHPPAAHDSAHHHLYPPRTHQDHYLGDGQPSRSKSTSPVPHCDDIMRLSVPPPGGGDDSSQGHDQGGAVEQHHQDVEKLTGGADASPHIHAHGNNVVENDTKSSVSKAPPPAPLDLSSVISSEEDHKSVPSQSDVMDILSIASKGSNEINAENLRKVQKETQIHAARKTMKGRERHREKSKKAAHSKGSKHDTMMVSHGHSKDVSHSYLLEGNSSAKPLSKTNALLQESIAATAAAKASGGAVAAPAFTDDNPSVKSTGGSKVHAKSNKKQKRENIVVKQETYFSSENEELDVVTPDSGSASLSISLRHDLMSEGSGIHGDVVQGHGLITLSADDLDSDVTDVEEVMDTIKPKPAASVSHCTPLWVKVNRELIASHTSHARSEDSDSSVDLPANFAVEYNPSHVTKMVIRTQPLPEGDTSAGGSSDVTKSGLSQGTDEGHMAAAKKTKKKKKKSKHKLGRGEDLKLKIKL